MKYLIIFYFLYLIQLYLIPKIMKMIIFVGKMDSYNKDFTLYFKTREKAILSRGEDYNYITDYPQDLYIYNHKLKTDEPLITYNGFLHTSKDYPKIMIIQYSLKILHIT